MARLGNFLKKAVGAIGKVKDIAGRIKKGIGTASKIAKAGLNVVGKTSKIITGGKDNKVSRFVDKAQGIRKAIKHGAIGGVNKAEKIAGEVKNFTDKHGGTITKAYNQGRQAIANIRNGTKT